MESLPNDFVTLLKEYISYRSISTDAAYNDDIEKTVTFLNRFIADSGGAVTIIPGQKTNPVVFGSYHVSEMLPTVLIYGHYDVQPAEHAERWSNQRPFEILEKDGRLVARGIVDNKGQNFIHLYTVANLFQENRLAYNVKFLLEGNEESGNDELPGLLKENKKLFAADYCIVSDGEIAGDCPVLESTLRGGANIKLSITTANTDLHSGIYGGAIPSSSTELACFVASLYDERGRITIPGFYEAAPDITHEMLGNNKKLSDITDPLSGTGVVSLLPGLQYDFYTHTGLLPVIEITGMESGYVGTGFANIVPGSAQARINIRTVPPQKTSEIVSQVVEYIKSYFPDYVSCDIELSDHGDGCVLDTESEFAQKIQQQLEKSHGHAALNKYVGGSIPILKDFQDVLGISVISVSLGNDDCNMHGIDENYRIDLVRKGLAFSESLFGISQ